MKKSFSAMVWILVLVTVISVAYVFTSGGASSSVISYSEFQQHWLKKEVKEITIESDGMSIEGTLKDGDKTFKAYVRVSRLENFLDENKNPDVKEVYETPQTVPFWITLLPNLILIIFMVAIFFMIIQQSSGGGRGTMNFGKSKAKLVNPDKQKITFKDVAGINEEKAELEEIVDFLKIPKRYIEMGARIPKGLLLVGPPGTGKTLLAKAVAGEAGVPFFSMSGSDFVEMFVGVGASRVRDLFEQAKKNSPCIIFIDEIDAVGRQRGSGMGGGHDEREQTLNQLLVEMDGFGVNEGIVVIAATNRVDILDKAILRPGRFDRQVMVNAPDVRGREEILKIHSKNKILGDDIKLDVIAKQTSGFTGADLENLMNEAALLAVRRKKNVITMSEIEESVTRVVAGLEKKSRVISEHDRKLTAYHEAGHAIAMRVLEHSDPVHQISIIPRGMAGGFTMHLPKEDRSYTSKNKLLDEMVSLLGGRIAEKLILGDISTGAHNDIERASKIARAMVTSYGMSDKLGPINFEKNQNEFTKNYSDEVAAKIDEEVKSLIDNAYERVEKILNDNMEKLHIVAKALLEEETLQADQFESLFTKGILPPKKEDIEAVSIESEATVTSIEESKKEITAEGEKNDINRESTSEVKDSEVESSINSEKQKSNEEVEENSSIRLDEEDKKDN